MVDFMKQVEQEVKEDRELARVVSQEKLILDVTELILEKMEDKDVSKSDLARILGTSKSHITQLLRGSRNMTLRTVADIFFDLDCEITVKVVSKEEQERETFSALVRWTLAAKDNRPVVWSPPAQLPAYEQPELIPVAA